MKTGLKNRLKERDREREKKFSSKLFYKAFALQKAAVSLWILSVVKLKILMILMGVEMI